MEASAVAIAFDGDKRIRDKARARPQDKRREAKRAKKRKAKRKPEREGMTKGDRFIAHTQRWRGCK